MKGMILAAGLGTRLKPFTDKHPKALAVVNNKTILQFTTYPLLSIFVILINNLPLQCIMTTSFLYSYPINLTTYVLIYSLIGYYCI